jgi:dihydrodipicolinate synthase/N-acetylneuraminate lyase
MMGRDALIFSSLIMGTCGAVPATGNIAPALLVEICRIVLPWRSGGKQAAQLRLNPLRLALGLCTAPGGVKAAQLLGRSIGPSRSPVSGLSADKVGKMRRYLEAAGLL